MPPEAPLAMPTQSLTQFRRSRSTATGRRRNSTRTPWLARLFVFGGALAMTVYGAEEMYGVVDVGGVTTLEWALLVLFVVNFSWIALTFTSSIIGFLMLLVTMQAGAAAPARGAAARTAVVMPIYNEAPSRVFARRAGDLRGCRGDGLGRNFDYFFLSDTTDPTVWIAEERAYPGDARAPRRRERASSTGTVPRTRAARPAISPISSPAGARATTTWWCSTPTA